MNLAIVLLVAAGVWLVAAIIDSINKKPVWKDAETDPPENGSEVLGYHPEWIDEDYNNDGVCLCFKIDTDAWIVSQWCGTHDEWHTRVSGEEDPYGKPTPSPVIWTTKPVKKTKNGSFVL